MFHPIALMSSAAEVEHRREQIRKDLAGRRRGRRRGRQTTAEPAIARQRSGVREAHPRIHAV